MNTRARCIGAGELKGQIYLGCDEFIEKISQPRDRLKEIPRIQRPARRSSLAELFASHERDKAILKAYREHGYTVREIADYLGVHYDTVSRRTRRQEQLKEIDSNVGLQSLTLIDKG